VATVILLLNPPPFKGGATFFIFKMLVLACKYITLSSKIYKIERETNDMLRHEVLYTRSSVIEELAIAKSLFLAVGMRFRVCCLCGEVAVVERVI